MNFDKRKTSNIFTLKMIREPTGKFFFRVERRVSSEARNESRNEYIK